jgi:hypothetical protein
MLLLLMLTAPCVAEPGAASLPLPLLLDVSVLPVSWSGVAGVTWLSVLPLLMLPAVLPKLPWAVTAAV